MRSYKFGSAGGIVACMATRPYHGTERTLFLKEHRKFRKKTDKRYTAAYLAELLGRHEKGVLKIEGAPHLLKGKAKQDQWAQALGYPNRTYLWSMPGDPVLESVDDILERADPQIHRAVVDLAKSLTGRQ